MSAHVLHIRTFVGGYPPRASITCHVEPGKAPCRVTCEDGCEQFDYPEHEHPLVPIPYCNALEFIENADDIWDLFAGPNDWPLRDGMEVDVVWNSDTYLWQIPLATTPTTESKEQ